MATKLRLVLQNPKLQLAFKALIFGTSLILVEANGFRALPIAIFSLVTFLLYTRPLFRTLDFLLPFLILLPTSLLVSEFTARSGYFPFAVIYFSTLFILLLGTKDLIFIRREIWQKFLNLALIYPVFLIFFFHNQSGYSIKFFLVFLAVFFLLKYLLKNRLMVWLLSFVTLEGIWAIGLLPIGFISASNLTLLFYFILTDLVLAYNENKLSRKKILIRVTVFITLFILIFAFSRWSL